MTFTATPPRASRPNEKPAPNSERVMVGNDALLSVFWESRVPLHHVADGLTVAVALRATDGLADIGIRCRNRLKSGLRAVVRSAEILARLVTLGLGVETVNGDEILTGIGTSGTVTARPVESVVTAWATALGAVGAGRFGADGGWDRAEGLGGFVFGGHGIWWLIGASAPADVRTLTPRRVITRKISNYFHGPILGLPLNIPVNPP